MKVLYIVYNCVPYGANVALINLLDGIKDKNVEALVIYAINGEFIDWLDEREIKNKQVKLYFNAYPKIYSFRSIISFLPKLIKIIFTNYKAVKEITNIVNDFKPNIIHTNIGPVDVGYRVAQNLNIPHVWHIREYQKLDFNIRFFPSIKSFYKKIERSYLISITQNLHEYFKMGKNARVIYDGVMSNSEHQFIVPKEKYFLFVGRLEEAKGTLLLVNAFCEFAKTNTQYKLLLAGTGADSYVASIKKILSDVQLIDRVELLGFRADRYDLMANATALIVPSRNEGFGFITAEAMFNGCLVIGNNTAGTKEIMENSNDNAIPFKCKEDLVNILLEVVDNGIEYYYDRIKNAQKIAINLYSKERHAKEVYNFYSEITNEANFQENN